MRRFGEACTWQDHLLELERAIFDHARSQQIEELKTRHNVTQKEHEAEIYRVRTEELEQVVAQRTQEIREAFELADAASRAKSTFLAITSHELRTPLNAVIGYAEMLLEEFDDGVEPDPDFFTPDLQRILSSARHLLTLIEKILQLSNLERGATELRQAAFSVADVLHDAARHMRALAEMQHNALSVEITPATDLLLVRSDQTQLREVVHHLVENALKFTTRGSVTVRAGREEDAVVIEVEDTGEGIDEETMTRIFEPFEQHDLSFTRIHEGLGLGLTLCRHHCQLLGATLTAESAPGAGATFVVRLPVG